MVKKVEKIQQLSRTYNYFVNYKTFLSFYIHVLCIANIKTRIMAKNITQPLLIPEVLTN